MIVVKKLKKNIILYNFFSAACEAITHINTNISIQGIEVG